MQFDVALHRLENEFGAKVVFEATPYTTARRTTADHVDELTRLRDVAVGRRRNGEYLALFTSSHRVDSTLRTHPDLQLEPILGP
jgi:peptide chain release factor 3